MKNNFEIRSSQFPYDMSAWCAEKSSDVAEEISRAINLLSQPTEIYSEREEQIKICLALSLYNITKLMAFSTGKMWTIEDACDVQENGYEGYRRIAFKYGIIDDNQKNKASSMIKCFCERLSKLLWNECYPNRTFIHELILEYKTCEHPIVEKTSELIELVTMGQLEWDVFCSVIENELKNLNIA